MSHDSEIRRAKYPDEVMNEKIDAVARALDRCAQERGSRIPTTMMRHLAVAAIEAFLSLSAAKAGAVSHSHYDGTTMDNQRMTIEQLRELVALQAEDELLWEPAKRIETAYVQQALRYLTFAIEGEWTFVQARDAIQEMMIRTT